MTDFYVEIYSSISDQNSMIPSGITLTPESCNWTDVGGCDKATVTGRGTSVEQALLLLGKIVVIYSDSGVPFWWGFIDSISCNINGVALAISFAEMYNRVKILYSTKDVSNNSIAGITSWNEDVLSISDYLIKEYVGSLTNSSLTTAEAKRDMILYMSAKPKIVPNFSDMSSLENTATFGCSGFYHSFDFVYYQNTDIGTESNITQLKTIALTTQFVTNAVGTASLGILASKEKKDSVTAKSSCDNLLALGSINGRRLVADITCNNFFTVREVEDDAPESLLYLESGGDITLNQISVYPSHLPIYGRYLQINSLPSILGISSVYISGCSYDFNSNKRTLVALGSETPFDLNMIRGG